MTKKQLIDLMHHLWENGWLKYYYDDFDYDRYLQSINDSPEESRTVNKHKAKEKICEHDYIKAGRKMIEVCKKCGNPTICV